MVTVFCIMLALLVAFLLGCGWYGEWSARQQPRYEFGKHEGQAPP